MLERINKIEIEINALYAKWEYYCYPDKTERCRSEIDNFLQTIDKLQDETSTPCKHSDVDNKKEKAKLLYLKGKILDLLPAYEKSADEFLSKSVPPDPCRSN